MVATFEHLEHRIGGCLSRTERQGAGAPFEVGQGFFEGVTIGIVTTGIDIATRE